MITGIILARGGSKGIPNKNIRQVGGKPLIAWSIEHSLGAKNIDSTWVSSDSQEILDIAKQYGANTIERPKELSADGSSSESAWLHSIDEIENREKSSIDLVVGLQATSPIRHISDLDQSISLFNQEGYDSILSVSKAYDHFIWHMKNDQPEALNYDFKNRKMRQDIKETFIENGSFYIFKPSFLKKYKNRLAGKIGFFELEQFKMFQIDEIEDIRFCEMIIKEYL